LKDKAPRPGSLSPADPRSERPGTDSNDHDGDHRVLRSSPVVCDSYPGADGGNRRPV